MMGFLLPLIRTSRTNLEGVSRRQLGGVATSACELGEWQADRGALAHARPDAYSEEGRFKSPSQGTRRELRAGRVREDQMKRPHRRQRQLVPHKALPVLAGVLVHHSLPSLPRSPSLLPFPPFACSPSVSWPERPSLSFSFSEPMPSRTLSNL